MERRHSFRNAALEVAEVAKRKGIATVGTVGPQGCGKSAFVRVLTHKVHQIMAHRHNRHYQYVEWGEDELMNMDSALETIQTHSIIHLDDISFVKERMKSKSYAEVRSVLSKIRHRPWGDVKIILMYSYHHSTAIDPFIRSTDFTAIPEITTPIIKNMAGDLWGGQTEPLYGYKRMVGQAQSTGRWGRVITIAKEKPDGTPHPDAGQKLPIYRYRAPFSPCLWRGKTGHARVIVYPHRQWMEPDGCSICGFDALKPCCRENDQWLEPDGCSVCGYNPDMEGVRVDTVPVADVDALAAELQRKYANTYKKGATLWAASRGHYACGKNTLGVVRLIEKYAAGHKLAYKDLFAALGMD